MRMKPTEKNQMGEMKSDKILIMSLRLDICLCLKPVHPLASQLLQLQLVGVSVTLNLESLGWQQRENGVRSSFCIRLSVCSHMAHWVMCRLEKGKNRSVTKYSSSAIQA